MTLLYPLDLAFASGNVTSMTKKTKENAAAVLAAQRAATRKRVAAFRARKRAAADVVLSYRPKPKSEPAKARKRLAAKNAKKGR